LQEKIGYNSLKCNIIGSLSIMCRALSKKLRTKGNIAITHGTT
jgi:hypothetical protein